MSETVIKVENISKLYRLGEVGTGTISHDLNRWWHKLRGKENPYLKIGQNNNRAVKGNSEYVWALKDVNFEVKAGEVLGIIGRNGAGKSTLLKILSRVTSPTSGEIKVKGRIASLLEVGTGFNPELTGRDNIYLNGAILGMRKREIDRKFDEIVAFAEVERYIDTPVKRYSSGMYVRLAFAVAAHLEPEILIVDEVLAVGDTEFQKKCLGKMSEVAHGGRTVLFVSHNMAAVKNLTSRALVLKRGGLAFDGGTVDAIKSYSDSETPNKAGVKILGSGQHASIKSVQLLDENGSPTRQYFPGKPLRLEVTLETDGNSSLSLEAFLVDATRSRIGMASLYQFHGQMLPTKPGIYICVLNLEPLWLASGVYAVDLATSVINITWDHYVESAVEFEVGYSNPLGFTLDFKHAYGYGSLALLSSEPVSFVASQTP